MIFLDTFKKIKVCTQYELNGVQSENLSSFINNLDKVKPIYETMSGWSSPTAGVKTFEELPKEAQEYISFLEKILNIPIKQISTGPKRNDIIIR